MKAIVITGPQGSGKTTLAKHIAGCLGTYMAVRADMFDTPFAMAATLKSEPDTLILDELRAERIWSAELQELIASRVIRVNERGRDSYLAPVPDNFIFCTGEDFILPAGDRRFHVITLTNRGNTP